MYEPVFNPCNYKVSKATEEEMTKVHVSSGGQPVKKKWPRAMDSIVNYFSHDFQKGLLKLGAE